MTTPHLNDHASASVTSSTSTGRTKVPTIWLPLKATYDALSVREKTILGFAAFLVLFAFIWLVLISPALQILKTAPAQHLVLDQEIQAIQKMAVEAKSIQAEPKEMPANFDLSLKSLSENMLPGKTNITTSGDRVTISINGVSGQNLSQWLEAIRTQLHSKPQDAQLKYVETQWQGTVVLALPSSRSK
jgi:general secretion pathway protein M